MCDLGFYEGIEGLLGDGQGVPEALILLREPNCERAIEFWFRKVVYKEAPNGTRYRGIYKRLIGKLLGISKGEDNDEDSDKDVRLNYLKKCAYMNLRPEAGKGTKSKEYEKVLEEFRHLTKENLLLIPDIDIKKIDLKIEDPHIADMAKQVAANRMRIIQRAIRAKVKYIVTTTGNNPNKNPDIYEALLDRHNVIWEESTEKPEEGEYQFLKRKYKYFRINETTIISFPHPSYTHISYNGLEELDQHEGNDLFKK